MDVKGKDKKKTDADHICKKSFKMLITSMIQIVDNW